MAEQTLLLVHAGATLYMAGLIWFVQLVHYPLLSRVGREGYAAYQRAHERLTVWAVGPAMLVELACAVWLILSPPADVSAGLLWTGLGHVALIWASTAFIQVPCHRRLSRGFDPASHRRLVRSNWIRTAAWSTRGLLAMLMLTG